MTDLQNFITNGFVLKKGLFSKQEIDKLNQYIAIRQDKVLEKQQLQLVN